MEEGVDGVYVCMNVFVCVCMYVCLYVCMCLREAEREWRKGLKVCICMCVCMCVCVCRIDGVYSHACMYVICILVHNTYIHTYTQLSPTHAGMLCGMASLLHEGCEDLDGAVALLNRCLLKHPYHAGALFQVCALGYACVCVCVRILYL